MKQVYVISGPPGSGKSTYVQDHATGKDLIVDLDYIAQALRGGSLYDDNESILDSMLDVRKILYDGIQLRKGKWENAYVITTDHNAGKVAEQLRGSLIQMNTPKEECKSRIQADDRRQNKDLYLSLIDDWFSDIKDISPTAGPSAGNITLLEDFMSEQNNATVNTPETATVAQPEQRTFTQTELDAIIRDRLSREREKYADYDTLKDKAQRFDAAEEAGKSELQKAQEKANALQAQLDALVKANSVNEIRAKVAQETGVPANLLSGDTEEACKTQAQGILAFAKPVGYPQVRDAGEVNKNTGTGKTRDQFASWFNENIK